MSSTPTEVHSIDRAVAQIEEQFGKKKPQADTTQHATSKPKPVEVKKEKPAPPRMKAAKPAAAAVSKPTKYLPTDRITFTRQLDILRAWAAASGPLAKTVTNNDVSEIVKMQASTISMANAFFSSVGFLVKNENGFIPAPEVLAFLRNYEWSPESAPQKLAPLLLKSWFADALLNKLSFGAMSEDECIQNLADASAAGPDYRGQLKTLLDYLAAAGLIQRDGNLVKKGNSNMTAASAAASNETPTPAKQESPTPDLSKTMPSLFGTTEGQVQFNIAVKVSMGEFANWQADRIAAFFSGIAQVLAAKAKVEKTE
jgi:hypothetical protein